MFVCMYVLLRSVRFGSGLGFSPAVSCRLLVFGGCFSHPVHTFAKDIRPRLLWVLVHRAAGRIDFYCCRSLFGSDDQPRCAAPSFCHKGSIGLPDVHSGYGFAVGNVAAFDMGDPDAVVSPGEK